MSGSRSDSDLLNAMKEYKIKEDDISMGIALLSRGSSPRQGDWIPHPTIKNASLVYAQVTIPNDSVKIVKADGRLIPQLGDLDDFTMKMYMGWKIFIHPDHMKVARSVLRGEIKTKNTVNVGFLALKRKAIITFSW